jgi:hypothetical protein
VHALSRGEERPRTVGSKSDGGVPVRVSQPGQATGIGPAWLRSDAPGLILFFFQRIDFPFSKNPCKVKKFIEIVLCIKI